MEHKLFVDTWGWLTLRDKQEAGHNEVAGFYCNCLSQGGLVYTTDYILDETFTLLFRRLSFSKAKESMELLLEASQKRALNIEFITSERFFKTKSLRIKYKDKPNISYTDLSSMVVMDELRISKILTADKHFTHVGMEFQTVP